MTKLHKNKEAGLTLTELLVGLALFAVVVVLSSAALVRMIRSERAAVARQRAYDNARFVFENVARNVRISQFCPRAYNPNLALRTLQNCGSRDPDAADKGKFLEIDHPTRIPSRVIYRWDDTGRRLLENGQALSGSQVFTKMWFRAEGIGSENPFQQPRITIFGEISTAGLPEEEVVVYLQTTVSQRLLETTL